MTTSNCDSLVCRVFARIAAVASLPGTAARTVRRQLDAQQRVFADAVTRMTCQRRPRLHGEPGIPVAIDDDEARGVPRRSIAGGTGVVGGLRVFMEKNKQARWFVWRYDGDLPSIAWTHCP
jgi:hypothetical protein